MGLNFSKAVKAAKTAKSDNSAAAPAPSNVPEVGRERLRHFNDELEKGHGCVAELETRVARLETITADAIAADQALQFFIATDAGIALAAYSAGEATADSEIAKLIAAAKATSEAAAAAKVALPTAQAALENARGQVVSIGNEKAAEIRRVVMQLADVALGLAYKKSFAKTARLHDQLLGFARATQGNIGEIALIEDELVIPRFALSSLQRTDGHYDPYMRANPNDFTVVESTKAWRAVKARLELDVDADLSDLIADAEK